MVQLRGLPWTDCGCLLGLFLEALGVTLRVFSYLGWYRVSYYGMVPSGVRFGTFWGVSLSLFLKLGFYLEAYAAPVWLYSSFCVLYGLPRASILYLSSRTERSEEERGSSCDEFLGRAVHIYMFSQIRLLLF